MTPSKKIEILNYTPHPITVVREQEDGSYCVVDVFDPYDEPIRLKTRTVMRGEINGSNGTIPLCRTFFGDPINLRPQEKGKLLIVSQLVKNVVTWRPDLIVPDGVKRNQRGAIIGCTRFGL